MTEDPERELTPEEDARIRSLLASARASEEAPDYVAARLDSVLADLAIDRATDRAADRGRRVTAHAGSRPWWRRGRVLLAAAVGVGVVSLAAVSLPQLSGRRAAAGPATRRRARLRASPGPRPTSSPSAPGVRPPGWARTPSGATYDGCWPPAPTAASWRPRPAPSGRTGDELASGACPASPEAGVVRSREVLLDGKLALLEVFGVRDGARVVRAVSCDGKQTLASTRIPAD